MNTRKKERKENWISVYKDRWSNGYTNVWVEQDVFTKFSDSVCITTCCSVCILIPKFYHILNTLQEVVLEPKLYMEFVCPSPVSVADSSYHSPSPHSYYNIPDQRARYSACCSNKSRCSNQGLSRLYQGPCRRWKKHFIILYSCDSFL
jgi:hypothetical protein